MGILAEVLLQQDLGPYIATPKPKSALFNVDLDRTKS